MENNQLINADEAVNLFGSYVDRLSTVYNDGIEDTSPEIQLDVVYQCTKRRIEGFLKLHDNFNLVQTFAALPNTEEYGADVVNALEANDYGYLINKFNVDMKIEKPMVIQTIIDEPIEQISDNCESFKIRGGILLINPSESGFVIELSTFTQMDDMDGIGICHHTEKYKYELIEGRPTFVKVHGTGFVEDVDVTNFETYLLMQIPFYLMLKDSEEKPYIEVAMNNEPKVEVDTTKTIQ